MAKLIILYGHPTDPAAFEDYYTHRHLPFAAQHMPNVRGAEPSVCSARPQAARRPITAPRTCPMTASRS